MPSALRYALPLLVTATNRAFAKVTEMTPRSDVLARLRWTHAVPLALVATSPP